MTEDHFANIENYIEDNTLIRLAPEWARSLAHRNGLSFNKFIVRTTYGATFDIVGWDQLTRILDTEIFLTQLKTQ